MTRYVALISEHASPLAVLGGVDCGGQNVYVGQVAKNLAALGYEVDVFTRRDNEVLPETADWIDGVRIVHVPAGPAEFVRKESLLPFMGDLRSSCSASSASSAAPTTSSTPTSSCRVSSRPT
jgi:hypothetical protein